MNRENTTSLTNIENNESKEKRIEIHDLYKIVGHQNRFQVLLILYICVMIFVLAFVVSFRGFAFKTPRFRCPSNLEGPNLQ